MRFHWILGLLIDVLTDTNIPIWLSVLWGKFSGSELRYDIITFESHSLVLNEEHYNVSLNIASFM